MDFQAPKAGWIKINREILDSWIWKIREPFDKRSAWIDILLMANYKDSKVYHNGSFVQVNRGQVMVSIRKLAEHWMWSVNRVQRYLRTLVERGSISKLSNNERTIITVTNYNFYQGTIDAEKETRRALREYMIETTGECPPELLDYEEYAPCFPDEYAPLMESRTDEYLSEDIREHTNGYTREYTPGHTQNAQKQDICGDGGSMGGYTPRYTDCILGAWTDTPSDTQETTPANMPQMPANRALEGFGGAPADTPPKTRTDTPPDTIRRKEEKNNKINNQSSSSIFNISSKSLGQGNYINNIGDAKNIHKHENNMDIPKTVKQPDIHTNGIHANNNPDVSGFPPISGNDLRHGLSEHTEYAKPSEKVREETLLAVRKQIDSDSLLAQYTEECIRVIVNTMADMLLSDKPETFNGIACTPDMIHERIRSVTDAHVRDVIEAVDKNRENISNPGKYLKTALFNAPVSVKTVFWPSSYNDNGSLRDNKNHDHRDNDPQCNRKKRGPSYNEADIIHRALHAETEEECLRILDELQP